MATCEFIPFSVAPHSPSSHPCMGIAILTRPSIDLGPLVTKHTPHPTAPNLPSICIACSIPASSLDPPSFPPPAHQAHTPSFSSTSRNLPSIHNLHGPLVPRPACPPSTHRCFPFLFAQASQFPHSPLTPRPSSHLLSIHIPCPTRPASTFCLDPSPCSTLPASTICIDPSSLVPPTHKHTSSFHSAVPHNLPSIHTLP